MCAGYEAGAQGVSMVREGVDRAGSEQGVDSVWIACCTRCCVFSCWPAMGAGEIVRRVEAGREAGARGVRGLCAGCVQGVRRL